MTTRYKPRFVPIPEPLTYKARKLVLRTFLRVAWAALGVAEKLALPDRSPAPVVKARRAVYGLFETGYR